MKKAILLLTAFIFLQSVANAQWQQTNGPYGKFITCMTSDGTNIFAGTESSGVFLSTNNGSSWTAVNNGLPSAPISSLAISGSNIFAGTYYAGVFLSTNNGNSWTVVNYGLPGNPIVYSLAISGSNIFAGTNTGVFLSGNNGSSWDTVSNGLTTATVHSLAISGSNIFAGTGLGGVFFSNNNGNSWTAINNGLPGNTVVYSLAINGSNIFAGTLANGVFLSTNNGSSWAAVNNGLPGNTDVYSLAISGLNIFAGTGSGGGIFLSSNNGNSWTAVNNGLPTTIVSSLAISGLSIFAGTGDAWGTAGSGAFLSTNNGGSWTAVNNGLTTTNVLSFAINGSNIFAGTDIGVFLSTNNGSSWTTVNNGLTYAEVLSLTISGSNIFAGTYGNGVFLSSNNGSSWAAVNNGLPANTYVYSLAISGSNIFAGTDGRGVWEHPFIFLTTSTTNLSCFGGNNGTAVALVSDSNPPYTYLWSNGSANDTIVNLTGGIYYVTVTDNLGSTITDSALISQPPPPIINSVHTAICLGDSIFLQNNYQTAAGIYYDSLSSVNSCDSIIATTLTVNSTYSTSATATICSSDSIFLQNNYQTAGGTYYDTLSSVSSCDSVIATTLTLNSNPPTPTITQNGFALICSTSGISNYQWFLNGNILNCITDTCSCNQNGSYTVTITDGNGCTASSSSFNATNCNVGIEENKSTIYNFQSTITMIPNPTTGKFQVSGKQHPVTIIEIYNVLGEIIYFSVIHSFNNSLIDLSSHPKGIYFIQLQTSESVVTKKLVVE